MSEKEIEEDPRFKLSKREMLISIIFYIIFWTISCYIGWWGMTKPTISYIFGFPDWFFLSAFIVYPVFIVIAIIMALRIKETPLDPWLEEETEG